MGKFNSFICSNTAVILQIDRKHKFIYRFVDVSLSVTKEDDIDYNININVDLFVL